MAVSPLRFFLATGLVATGLAACTATPAVTVVRTNPGDKVEEIKGDNVKLTINFPGYGQKKMVEKFAGLEKA